MKKLLPIFLVTTTLLLLPNKVMASFSQIYPELADKKIKIVTTFKADFAGNENPKVRLILNNGDGYYDSETYTPCAAKDKPENYTPYNGCGTPNLYLDKKYTDIEITKSPFVHEYLVNANDLISTRYEKPPTNIDNWGNLITKISYVYHNDYKNIGSDRNVYITDVKFIDAEDNKLLIEITPQHNIYHVENINTKLVFAYDFDYGKVNTEGIKDETQDGLVKAFDLINTDTTQGNKSKENNKWSLKTEGSFNIKTLGILTILTNKYTQECKLHTVTDTIMDKTTYTLNNEKINVLYSKKEPYPYTNYILKKDYNLVATTPQGFMETHIIWKDTPNSKRSTSGKSTTTFTCNGGENIYIKWYSKEIDKHDTNRDGVVNIKDAILILKYLFK